MKYQNDLNFRIICVSFQNTLDLQEMNFSIVWKSYINKLVQSEYVECSPCKSTMIDNKIDYCSYIQWTIN